MRPHPKENMLILQSAFGEDNLLELSPATLRVADSAVEDVAPDMSAIAPQWAVAMNANESSKIYLTVCSGFAKAWQGSGRPALALPPPPTNVDEAYKLWFQLQPPTHDVRRLLGVVMAAREPLSSAQLDALGLLGARAGLPGWGLLFEDREHLLQTLHLSVREFLLDPNR